ncbi:MAG TPA: arsenate reductase (glutaredoxin) [Fontimonas sp.]
MKDQLLHNPRCSKSREALKLLQDRGIEVPVVEYLEQPLSKAQLKALCGLLGVRPVQLVRTKEALFDELGLSVDSGSDASWLGVLAKHPRLLERPILVYHGRAAIGRPTENLLTLL